MTTSTPVQADNEPGKATTLVASANTGILDLVGASEVFFYRMFPVAVCSGGVVYLHPSVMKGAQAAVNRAFPGAPQMRLGSTQEFDYHLGQVLTQAGLKLVHREA
jgi:hypothetical protein